MTDFSRDASDYEYDPEDHVGNRKRERNIPIKAIDHIIEEGDAKQGKKRRVNFEGTWSGATITVVVNPREEYIVTTFYGTSKTGQALDEAQQRKKERERKIAERTGAAYTSGWQ